MSMSFLSNFRKWPAAAVHKKALGAVLFRSEFKSLSDLLQHRTLWPARSEVGRYRPMCVRVSAVVPSRRVDPLMGRNPLSSDSSRPSADHRGGPPPGRLITFSARSTSAGRAVPCCLQSVNTTLLYATFFSASPSLMPSASAIPLP